MKPVCAQRLGLLLLLAAAPLSALESPTSDGSVATLDTPVLRLPLMRALPAIDGTFTEKEWEDAAALSAFWSSSIGNKPPRYEHLAPHQIQSKIYAGFDRENLYLAYLVNVYPKSSWLKANGRFPDVYNHPLYGLMGDDHVEFELRPYHEVGKAYRLGLFKWFVNPIGTVSDQLWTVKEGLGKAWQSQAAVRAGQTDDYWVVEMRIPFQNLKVKDYAEKDEKGQELLQLPPPDGTAWRCWFKNGIGGAGQYVVLFDQHTWNTTKTKLVLDSQSVGFQVNELGPIMEDVIDVTVTLKNHNKQSENVRLGFFVENAEGLIYSSYSDEATNGGMVELVPGETKTLHLRKKMPGISADDNYLWFDVRTEGRPAKVLFQNRLAKFHSVDPTPRLQEWRKYKVDSLAKMRPPKRDFDFRYQYSPYTGRLAGYVDRGIHGASDEARKAVEAKLVLMKAGDDEELVKESTSKFNGDFATFELDLPDLKVGSYKVALLLLDDNQRLVGERTPEPFYKGAFEWERNKLGLDDVVWAPFTPIEVEGAKLKLFKHEVEVAPSGLPAQIVTRPDPRELPLELRGAKQAPPEALLTAIGRGPQLRAPVRFEAVVKGQRIPAEVVEPAKLVRQWKSEAEYAAKLKAGPLDLELVAQYDCDGSLTAKLAYGAAQPVEVEGLELVMDVAGPIDLRVGGLYGMLPSSGLELILPRDEGVVWDSAKNEYMEGLELYYSRFCPFLFFGSGDRGFTWLCDSDRGWTLDRAGSSMTLERNAQGEVTWRVKFVNHAARIEGKREIEFCILTHPAKPKEEGYRRVQWLDWHPQNYEGTGLKCLPNDGPCGIDGSDETFQYFTKQYPKGAPRLYFIKNWQNSGTPPLAKGAYTGEWLLDSSAKVDATPMDALGGYEQPWTRPGKGLVGIEWGSKSWEDFYCWHVERMIRIGRVPGLWWDETHFPVRTNCLANGQAYFRATQDVKPNELPFQSNFGSLNLRELFKRIARLHAVNNVPNLHSLWATSATSLESYAACSEMVESAAGYSLSYEIDYVNRYPISLVRYVCNSGKSLTTRVNSRTSGWLTGITTPGDDPRIDRAYLGRALLHDFGVSERVNSHEHYARVLSALYDFGYFDEAGTEMLPYWRNGRAIRFGEGAETDGFAVDPKDPFAKVYTTVYRRALRPDGKGKGYQALIVVMNENDEPIRGRLHFLDSKALFGQANNLSAADVSAAYRAPSGLSFKPTSLNYGNTPCLLDLETGGAITKATKGEPKQVIKEEIYGPLYIPAHDFRVLYARFDPDEAAVKAERQEKTKAARAGYADLPTGSGLLQNQTWWEVWKKLPQEAGQPAQP
ncbi:MAG: DUF6067 family protein [Planctomycetota bacterium]|nr:DUF6067 family protein [Planctomycetota bacterium]